MFSPSKLTPGPLRTHKDYLTTVVDANGDSLLAEKIVGGESDWDVYVGFRNPADAEFHVLARRAFDVMMRRGWTVELIAGTWRVYSGRAGACAGEFETWLHERNWSDPFTALFAADEWYAANVEGSK